MGSFLAGSYASAAGRLPAGLDVALKRDLGLSPSQYLADAAASAQAVKVVASLKSVGVAVLGSRIDGTQLTVNIASAADAATVQQADAIAVVGAPTLPDFSKTKFTSVTSTTTYGGEAYFYQSPGQTGGMGYRCSIGFNGYSGSTGAPEFATAGHCETAIAPGTPAYFLSQTAPAAAGANPVLGSPIGTAVAGQYGGGDDYGIISSGDAGIAPQNSIATWGGSVGTGASASISTGAPTASAPLGITGETAGIVGATLCKSGSSSGYTCGLITAVDTPVLVSGETVNAIVATTCLLPGDSGGAAVVGTNAVGIDSGTSSTSATSCTNAVDQDGDPAQYVYFPMVSSAGSYSVSGQQGSNWQLGVAVSSTVTVTSPSSGARVSPSTSLTGTITDATSGSTALLYLDGSATPFAKASASTGSWTIPLSGVPLGAHTYTVAAGLGWSPGTPVAGTFTMVASQPEGSFDSATGVPGGISISGWSLDLSTTASTYVWVNVDGSGGPVLANASLPWINALYPGEGTNHGFSATLAASPGNHTVCVYGTSPLVLGCKSVVVPQNAQGSFDSASGVVGGIQISGWSLDLSTTASTYVWVNVDGSGGPVLANGSLPWINALFPGEGVNHGFAETVGASPGNHTVCVFGTNSLALGCKTVTVPISAHGSFDSAAGVPGGIAISGWSLDLSTTASTYIWVNVDGSGGPMLANVSLPWINALYPGEGVNHGFTGTVSASPGVHTVCVYGTSPLVLGCKTVTVPQNAQGSLDSATGVSGGIQISGWSLDLSTTASTYVWVNVDGSGGPYLANVSLPWINALYPGEGTNHGFAATISAPPGSHTVCVYGTNSILLGCKGVNVPAAAG